MSSLFHSVTKAFIRSQVFTSSAEKLVIITGRLLVDSLILERVTCSPELEVYHPCTPCKQLRLDYPGVSCGCQVMLLRFKGSQLKSEEHVKAWKFHRGHDQPACISFPEKRSFWYHEGEYCR